ncbi:hypothetical protein L9F63_026520 [Diploptera punctata]|uniref:Uncharacterized protein n=1 Tax=Diploptera punctata TaxID=6984 RepID=A0AAD8AIH8_DIPPU|nr:hypothetical protein L9F63_026520 [Diploptera punctata]
MVKLVHQKEQHLVKETCKYLQQMFHSSLPETIAYEMKLRILREFEDNYIKLTELCDSEDDYIEIATDIFIAILDPSVTRIGCVEYTSHPKLLDGFKMRSSDLVYSAIYKLKNVTALRIADAIYCNKRHELGECLDQKITENLDEFRNGMSSNREIRTLFEQCKKLRILDVGDSQDIYEESINYIVNMECLEELDIHYTSIYTIYTGKLLNRFVNTRRSDKEFVSTHLKKFGCDALSQEQICLIGEKFPNLTCLKVMHVDCDLIPLKGLKHLKHLQVGVSSYQYLEKLLTCIGKQLVCLDVKNTSDVDLQHVASNCSSLICLHLGNNPLFESYFKSRGKKSRVIPTFPHVTRLELEFDDQLGVVTQCILSAFHNVKRLFLSHCSNDKIFDFVLQRKCMKHLEIAFFMKFNDIYIALQFYDKYAVVTDFPIINTKAKITYYSFPI